MILLNETYAYALEAIVKGSEVILRHYRSEIEVVTKIDGSPVTQADLESSNTITEILNRTNIPVICEEHEIPEYDVRKQWGKFWCVDPLDGTKMFLARNDEFAVNIALIENNEPIFGAIGDPVNQQILLGIVGIGAFLIAFEDIHKENKWIPITPNSRKNNPLTIICSRNYLHGSGFKFVQELERKHGEVQFIMKGSALKFFDLALGTADLYTRFAPTMEWDIAAGDAILQCLGGKIVQVDSNIPVRYNKVSLYNPHFIAKTKQFLTK